ncbi:hypothetical protein OSTOST_04581 [Ostertagia ostertagi]
MPVVLNELLVKVVISLLLTYSIFFSGIPIGYDTTHLSHVYDLIFAYQRLFFAISLTLRSEKYGLIMKRSSRIGRIVEKQTEANLIYFSRLRQMW